MTNYYVNYEHFYKCRPNEEDLTDEKGDILVEGHFPKTICKGKYILSKYPYVSYRIIKEFEALHKLHKPLIVCATTGYWPGDPFLLKAEDNVFITLEDEKYIIDYFHGRVK